MANREGRKRARAGGLAAWVATGLLSVAGAAADVIVLRDGVRVATSGEWEVRGTTVVFHDEHGRLRSLQRDQIDLAASRRETARRRQEARQRRHAGRQGAASPSGTLAARPPALVITDADVEHVDPERPGRDEDPDGADTEAAHEGGPLVVSEWTRQVDPDVGGVTVRGSVRNTGDDTVGSLRVVIELYDAEGTQIASTTADVRPPALTPRASGRFQVRIPGILEFDDARFRVDSVALTTQDPRPAVVPQRAYEARRRAEEEPDSR